MDPPATELTGGRFNRNQSAAGWMQRNPRLAIAIVTAGRARCCHCHCSCHCCTFLLLLPLPALLPPYQQWQYILHLERERGARHQKAGFKEGQGAYLPTPHSCSSVSISLPSSLLSTLRGTLRGHRPSPLHAPLPANATTPELAALYIAALLLVHEEVGGDGLVVRALEGRPGTVGALPVALQLRPTRDVPAPHDGHAPQL